MKIERTSVPGVLLFEPDVFEDSRGYFKESIAKHHGFDIKQVNQEWSHKGVIRGMHGQRSTAKLVWVVKGSIFDVALNPGTVRWTGHVLSAENHLQMYIPADFAHGIQTLEDDTIVCFVMSEYYNPSDEWGYDPLSCGIEWPLQEAIISDKDRNAPKYSV